MHELSITKSLINTVLSRFDGQTMESVKKINLVMGAMNDYDEAWLQKYFDELAVDTPLAGAKLSICKVPITFKCRSCNEVFPMDLRGVGSVACPCCGGLDYGMNSGREFFVENMEVVDK